MNNNDFIVAPIKNRFFAFLIDVFFVYLIRFFYINVVVYFWLKEDLSLFLSKYKLLFGNVDLNRITNIEVMFFLRSNLFKELVLFAIGMFIISIIYDTVFLLTKWSATLGQKLLGIYTISNNNKKIKWYQILTRGITMNIPWIFIFFILFAKNLGKYDVNILDQQTFVISFLLFLSWFDLAFLTKNRIVFHDYITRTVVVIKNKEKYIEDNGGILNVLFPDLRDIYRSLKEGITEQIKNAKEIKRKYKEEKEKNNKDNKKK